VAADCTAARADMRLASCCGVAAAKTLEMLSKASSTLSIKAERPLLQLQVDCIHMHALKLEAGVAYGATVCMCGRWQKAGIGPATLLANSTTCWCKLGGSAAARWVNSMSESYPYVCMNATRHISFIQTLWFHC
jgi:hypothetical protein